MMWSSPGLDGRDEYVTLPREHGTQANLASLGSSQNDSTKLPNSGFDTTTNGDHNHQFKWVHWHHPSSGDISFSTAGSTTSTNTSNSSDAILNAGNHSHIITGGDSETRPRNVALLYCVKD